MAAHEPPPPPPPSQGPPSQGPPVPPSQEPVPPHEPPVRPLQPAPPPPGSPPPPPRSPFGPPGSGGFGGGGASGGPPLSPQEIRNKVMPPAICLMVMAGIAIVWTLFSTLVQGAGTEEYITLLEGMANDQNRELIDGMIQAMSGEGSVLIMILSTGLTMLFSCLIALGGFKMMRLESWGLALAGSIAAVIPCFSPCCCLTIPFGVWALVILNDPRIKAAFH